MAEARREDSVPKNDAVDTGASDVNSQANNSFLNEIHNDRFRDQNLTSIPDIKSGGTDNGTLKGDAPQQKQLEIQKIDESFKKFEKKDGVQQLPTGDFLVRKDGNETLFTPKGDQVTVNKDGSYETKGNVRGVKSDKYGDTTVTFADGTQVKFDREGIKDVSRGDQSVHLPRRGDDQRHAKPEQTGGDALPKPLPKPVPQPGPNPFPHPGPVEGPIPKPFPPDGGHGTHKPGGDQIPHPKPAPDHKPVPTDRGGTQLGKPVFRPMSILPDFMLNKD